MAVLNASRVERTMERLAIVVRDDAGGNGPAAVFIDIIGRPLTPLSYAGVARRTVYRGAWYAGAAAEAAAAPYYGRPPCGYPPYPPCY